MLSNKHDKRKRKRTHTHIGQRETEAESERKKQKEKGASVCVSGGWRNKIYTQKCAEQNESTCIQRMRIQNYMWIWQWFSKNWINKLVMFSPLPLCQRKIDARVNEMRERRRGDVRNVYRLCCSSVRSAFIYQIWHRHFHNVIALACVCLCLSKCSLWLCVCSFLWL